MIIISYDIAVKSLASSVLYINELWRSEFDIIVKNFNSQHTNIENTQTDNTTRKLNNIIEYISKLNDIMSNIIVPLCFDVVDLTPNKKIKDTDTTFKTKRLKGYLHELDTHVNNYIKSDKVIILLEYQMGPNDISRNICSQILYHYSDIDNNFNSANLNKLSKNSENSKLATERSIYIVGPSLKNKLIFTTSILHNDFIKKYATSYMANKKHSIANFLYWISTNNYNSLIKNIKKINLDDIADSFNMAIAWILFKSNLVRYF